MDESGLNSFCNSTFWDVNLTWNSDSPRLTPCFQKTVLVWIPSLFLWIFSSIDIYNSLTSKSRNIPWNWRNISKLVLVKALIVICIFELFYNWFGKDNVALVDIITPIIKSGTLLLCSCLILSHKKFGRRSSGIVFLFWFIVVILGWVQCHSDFEDRSLGIKHPTQISYMALYILSCISFFLNFISDLPPTFTEYPKVENPSPEDGASFPSRLTFSWFNSLAYLGFKKPLVNTDLWSMRYIDRTSQIFPVFDKYWSASVKKNSKVYGDKSAKFRKRANSVDISGIGKAKVKPTSILPALCKGFGPAFVCAAFLKLIQDLMTFVSPKLLEYLIDFVELNEPQWRGFLYAVLLFIVATCQTLFLSQYFNLVMLVGLRIRTSLISAIYRKALKLSNAARKESTVGEIVNLMSVDAQRFMDLVVYLNMIWSAPLQIGVALYFLWQTLGPCVLAGLGVMIFMIPLNGFIANRVKILQIKQMKNKDERVKMMNEILSGIKVLKLYAWEPSFEQQVMKIRDKEVKVLKQSAYFNASTSFIWSCAPFLVSASTFAVYVMIDENNVLDAKKAFVALSLFNIMRMPLSMLPMVIVACTEVSLVTFATYVLLDPNNILDAKKAFVALSLFNILRFPLSMLPMMISNAIQTSVSVKRINKFMNSEEIDPTSISHSDNEDDPLVMEKGTFSWGLDDEPTLHNINLKVKAGSLVAVVGTVGSGKSSLISAFLGEMDKKAGRVNIQGSVAYVPQLAWIQNATLQDNILFGKSLNNKSYHKVVDACALIQDLEMLPAGDQTEIGEKGINLSGGQKQRVSLARAVFADCDIYFLDDPLSAVDSHVGKHIFESVISSKGILRKKTRIFVTHSISFLPEVDQIVVLKEGTISEVGTYRELLEKKGAFSEFLTTYLQEVDNENLDGLDETLKEQILTSNPEIQRQLSRQKSVSSETSSMSSLTKRKMSNSSQQGKEEKPKGDKLIEEEKAEIGGVKWDVYKHYLRSIGLKLSLATIILNVIYQGFSVASNLWLSKWSSDAAKISSNGTQDTDLRNLYLEVYGLLGVGQTTSTFLGTICWFLGCIQASVTIHKELLSGIIHSPLSFFDTTQLGRILNRFASDVNVVDLILPHCILQLIFLTVTLACQVVMVLFAMLAIYLGALQAAALLHSLLLSNILRVPNSFFDITPLGRVINRLAKDVDILDNVLPMTLRGWCNCFFSVIGTLFVISYSTPVFISVILPIGLVYYFLQKFYVATSRQLKRLESVSRSPIYSHFGESVSGCSSIRAYNAQERFIRESEDKVDLNQICTYPGMIANRWLAVRLEMVGNLIIFFSALFSVLGKGSLSPGIVGLSVSYALQITQTLNWLVRMTADIETNIVAVERIKEYVETPQEAPWEITPSLAKKEWPEDGKVVFTDYKVRYRPGLDLVLKGISFTINGGEKVGIVGRTGAGKSSLTLSLFRIIEAAEGKILIDGIDIAKLGLHSLRSRLTIIPQDPVLFSGSLRINLDPFCQYSDDEIWRALELSHLKTFVKALTAGLQHEVTEGGENLSVGQRQLICLARALLRKTKVLILDEATAAVDLETDDLIQKTIRSEFKHCTVLTIAHRLNTIIDSDRHCGYKGQTQCSTYFGLSDISKCTKSTGSLKLERDYTGPGQLAGADSGGHGSTWVVLPQVLVLDKGTVAEFDSPTALLKNKNSIFHGMAHDAGLV